MGRTYTPYNFDEKYEYKIYSQIGVRYHEECSEKKRKKNRKRLSFDKYSDWEKYFLDKFLMSDYNVCNFLHYLKGNLRVYQMSRECIKNLVIPIYVAILTIILTIYSTVPIHVEIKDLIITLFVGTIIIIIVGMFFLYQFGRNINFYKDCIKIIKNTITSHQK